MRNYFKTIFVFLFLEITTVHATEKNAGLAMLLCVAPGGGQFYTERYIPGVLIASTELALGYYAYKYHREDNYEKRNSLLWWELFVFGFSLADAYVGAKLYNFDLETDLNKISMGIKLRW
jgi:hypothetical protein